MQLNSAEKKTLAIIAAMVVAFAAIVGGTVAVLVTGASSEDDERPYLHLAVGDRLVEVEPAIWCDVFRRECDPPTMAEVTIPRVPVEVGQTVVLSVPASIAQSPWRLIAQYWTPRGPVADASVKLSGTTYTVSLPSREDYALINIEVQVVSAVPGSDDESFETRGFLAVNTTPDELVAAQSQ